MAVASPFSVIQQLLQSTLPSSSSSSSSTTTTVDDTYYTKISSVFKSTFLSLNIASYRTTPHTTPTNKSLTIQDGIKVLQSLLKLPSNDHIELSLQYLLLILPFLATPSSLPPLSMEKLYSQTLTSLCTVHNSPLSYQRQITILLGIGIFGDVMMMQSSSSSSSAPPPCYIPSSSISLIESLTLPLTDPSLWMNSLLQRLPLPNQGNYTMDAGKLFFTGLIYSFRTLLPFYTTNTSNLNTYTTVIQQRMVPWFTILSKIADTQYKKSAENAPVLQEKTNTNPSPHDSSSAAAAAFVTFLITHQTNFYTTLWKYCLDTEQSYLSQQIYNRRTFSTVQDFLQHILTVRTIAIEWLAWTAHSYTALSVHNLHTNSTHKDGSKMTVPMSTVKPCHPSKSIDSSSCSSSSSSNPYESLLDKVLGQSRWSVNKYLQAMGKYSATNNSDNHNNTNGNIDKDPLLPLVSSTHHTNTKSNSARTNAPSKYNSNNQSISSHQHDQKEQRDEQQKYKQNLEKQYTQEHLRPALDMYRRIHGSVKKYFPFPTVLEGDQPNNNSNNNTSTAADSNNLPSSTVGQGDNHPSSTVPATPAPKGVRPKDSTVPPVTVSKPGPSFSADTNITDAWPLNRLFTPYVTFLRSYAETCRMSNEYSTAVTIIRSLGMYGQRLANYLDTTVPTNHDSSCTLIKLSARFLSAECSAFAAFDTLRSIESTADNLEGLLGGISLSVSSSSITPCNDPSYVTGKTNAAALLRTSVATVQKYGSLLIQYVNQQSRSSVSNVSGVTRRLAMETNVDITNENITKNSNESTINTTTNNDNLESATLSLSRISDTWLQICEWWQSHANLGLGVQTTTGTGNVSGSSSTKVGTTKTVSKETEASTHAPVPVKKTKGVRFTAEDTNEPANGSTDPSPMDTSFHQAAATMATPAKRLLPCKPSSEDEIEEDNGTHAPVPMTPFPSKDTLVTMDNDKDNGSSGLMTGVKKPSNPSLAVIPPPPLTTVTKPPSTANVSTAASNGPTSATTSTTTMDWWLLLEQAALVLTKLTNEFLTTIPLSSSAASVTSSSSSSSFTLPAQTPFTKSVPTATPQTSNVSRSLLSHDTNTVNSSSASLSSPNVPLRYCLSAAAKCTIIAARSRLVRLHLAAAGINLTGNTTSGKGILALSVRKSWYLLLSAGLLPTATSLGNQLIGASSDTLALLCDSPGSLLLLNTDAMHHIKKVIQYVTDGHQLAIQVGSSTGLTLVNDMNTILMNTAVPMINAALQQMSSSSPPSSTATIPSSLLSSSNLSSNPVLALQPELSDTDREHCANIAIQLLSTICQGWEQWMMNYDYRRQQLLVDSSCTASSTAPTRLFTSTASSGNESVSIEKGRNDALYADAFNISQLSLRYSLLNACYTVVLRKNTLQKSLTESTQSLVYNIQRAIYWHVRDTLADIQAQLCMDSLQSLILESSAASTEKHPNVSKDTIFDNLMPLLSNAIFGNPNDTSIENMYTKATSGILDLVTYVSKGAISLIRKIVLPLMNTNGNVAKDRTKASLPNHYASLIDPMELGTLIATALLDSVNDVVLTNITSSAQKINENIISSTLVPLAVSISILRSTGYVAVRKTAQLLKQLSHLQRTPSSSSSSSVASDPSLLSTDNVRYQTERWISLFFGLFSGLASCGDRNMSCGALITLEVASAVHALTYVIQTGQRMFYHYQYKPSVSSHHSSANDSINASPDTVPNDVDNDEDITDDNDNGDDDHDKSDGDDDSDTNNDDDEFTIQPVSHLSNDETEKAWCLYCASYQLLRPVLQAMYAHASSKPTSTLFPVVLMQQLYTQAIDSALCTNTSITTMPSNFVTPKGNGPPSSHPVHYGCNCENGIQTITNDVILHWLTNITVPSSITTASSTNLTPSCSSSTLPKLSVRNRIFLHNLQDRYQFSNDVSIVPSSSASEGLRKYHKEYATLLNLADTLRIMHDGIRDSLVSFLSYQVVWAHRIHTQLLPLIDKVINLGLSVSNVRSFRYTAASLSPIVHELLSSLMDIQESIHRQEPLPKNQAPLMNHISALPLFTNTSLLDMSRKYYGTIVNGLCHTVTGWMLMVTGPGVRSLECALTHYTCAINMWSKAQMYRLKENMVQRYSTMVNANLINFFLVEDGRIESLGLVECLTITGRLWLTCFNDSRRSIYCLQRALVICQAEGIDFLYTNTTDHTVSFASHVREWLSLAYGWQGNLDQAYKYLFLVTSTVSPSIPTSTPASNSTTVTPPVLHEFFLPSSIRNRFDSYKITTWNQILGIYYRKVVMDGCRTCGTNNDDKGHQSPTLSLSFLTQQFQSTYTLLYQWMDQERGKLLAVSTTSSSPSLSYRPDSIDEQNEYALLRTYRILQSISPKNEQLTTILANNHSLITQLSTKVTKHCGVLYEQSVMTKSSAVKLSMQQGIESFFTLLQTPWEYIPSLFVDTCRWLALYPSLNGTTVNSMKDFMEIWKTYLPNGSQSNDIVVSSPTAVTSMNCTVSSLIGPTLLAVSINPEFSLRMLRIFRERLLVQSTVSSTVQRTTSSSVLLPSALYDQYSTQLTLSLSMLTTTINQDLSLTNLVQQYCLRHDYYLPILYPGFTINPWNNVCLGIEPTTGTGLLGRVPSVYGSNGKPKINGPYICSLPDIYPSLTALIHEFRNILTDSFLSVTQVPGSTSTAAVQENQFTDGPNTTIPSDPVNNSNSFMEPDMMGEKDENGTATTVKGGNRSKSTATTVTKKSTATKANGSNSSAPNTTPNVTTVSCSVPALSETDKQNWWTSRFKIDKRLATVCEQLENKILTTIGCQGLLGNLSVLPRNPTDTTNTTNNITNTDATLPVTKDTSTAGIPPLDTGKLDTLKLTDLRGLAAERGIKLTTTMKKADIINVIKEYEAKYHSSTAVISTVQTVASTAIGNDNSSSSSSSLSYYTHSSIDNLKKDTEIFVGTGSASSPFSPNVSTALASLLSLGTVMNGAYLASSSLVLVLSSELQELPWESMPILRTSSPASSSSPPCSLSISRLPYHGFLHTYTLAIQSIPLLSTRLSSPSTGRPYSSLIEKLSPLQASIVRTGLSILQLPDYRESNDYLTYIINPSGDLVRTQTTLEPILHDMAIKTNSMSSTSSAALLPQYGIAGTKPLVTDILDYLRRSSLYVYCGHGTGESFCPRDTISKSLYGVPVSLLMGCSSGKLVPLTKVSSSSPSSYHYQASGVHTNDSIDGGILSYLIGGSPSVVGCLWDVTDKDIDRYTIGLLGTWSSSTNLPHPVPQPLGKGLSKAVNDNRSICKLPYLVGSAPVCYGIPL